MTTKLQMKHPINCTPEQFWEWVHFGGFNQVMYSEIFNYGFRTLEDDKPSGKRMTHVTPVVETAPKALIKVFGNSVSFEEHGQLDRSSDPWVYRFRVKPGTFEKKIQISGQLIMTPREGGSWREVDFDIDCSIFGVGGIFERFVKAEINKSYDQSAEFTNEFIARRHG